MRYKQKELILVKRILWQKIRILLYLIDREQAKTGERVVKLFLHSRENMLHIVLTSFILHDYSQQLLSPFVKSDR